MAPTIVVTGASRGLGAAMVRKLLTSPISANVVAIARTEAPLKALCDEFPGQVAYLTGDVSRDELNSEAIKLAVSKFGGIDGIIFNAAILDPIDPLVKADATAWRKLYDINFFSMLPALKEAIPHLKESKGKVVFISSGATHHYFYGWGAYGSSKAATDHLSATLAAEEPEIFSFSLDPGVMDTSMQVHIRDTGSSGMSSSEHDRFLKLKSESQLSPPEVPGGVAVNLVLDGPMNLSGKALRFTDEQLAKYKD
ncbi:uncharacterized protein V1516DRAFT_642920 [Lipomyces oligophaga]|uniref:uncharacterized protein n=1 Tax=Lipomyces oligophaga TaxID=45792 RepID=UPI0034CE580E